MEHAAVLSAKQLSAGYGKTVIVGDLEVEVQSGEILTLIGANGVGKSTVLRTIAAQLPAVAGAVYLDGRRLSGMKENEIARRLSVLLTERLRTERMSCGEVVETGRYPYTGRLGILSAQDRQAVQEAMALTGVTHLCGRDFRNISDGQRQCVMLARAIAQEPALLLLDEPTSFLDIRHKLRLLTLLRKLVREKQIAVIQTLHELDLAQKFSDRILCIRDGRAERIGTPEEIFSGDYIGQLYGLPAGRYNTFYGALEPEAVQGMPEVFVIGGGGSGIPVYRQLQRQGIPFAAGVLHENDVEFPAAKALAAVLIHEAAFEPICDAALQKAREVMQSCKSVICTVGHFGSMNRGNALLCEEAKRAGKLNVQPIENAAGKDCI